MALSNKEKQQALRDRRLASGMTEVRGIYATDENHAKIKAYAKKIGKKPKIT